MTLHEKIITQLNRGKWMDDVHRNEVADRILEIVKEGLPKKRPSPKGHGCLCNAYYSGECGCDADWADNDKRKEVEMTRNRYAIVRHPGGDGRYTFKKWHVNADEAFNEAERLTRKELDCFYVLKLVGFVKMEQVPIRTERWQ